MEHARYQIHSPAIVYELFDDEVVVVNLDTGSYYSLAGTGAFIWDRLMAGASAPDVVQELAQRYDGAEIEPAVRQFVADLHQESLLAPAEGREPDRAAPAPCEPGQAAGRPPFAAPVLNKFTDMQELLLLDPIHEVGEAGWPARAGGPDG